MGGMKSHWKGIALSVSTLFLFGVLLLVVFIALLGPPIDRENPYVLTSGMNSEALWLNLTEELSVKKNAPELNEAFGSLTLRPISAPGDWHPWERTEDELRIVMLGDSFTYGYLVESHDAFPAVLQDRLRERVPSDVVVINLASPGMGTQNEYELYQHVGTLLEPDLVVLGLHFNDWEDVRKIHPSSFKRTLLQRMRASRAGWMRGLGQYLWDLEDQKYREVLELDVRQELFAESFKDLLDITPGKCFLVITDIYYPLHGSEVYHALILRDSMPEYNYSILSLESFYSSHSSEEVTLPNDDHPNPFAHREIAGIIADYLLNDSTMISCLNQNGN